MSLPPESSRSDRRKRLEEQHATRPRSTDDGIPFDVVENELERRLDIRPIEPPPFVARDRSAKSAMGHKEATSTPNGGPSNPGSRQAKAGGSEPSAVAKESPPPTVVFGTDSRKLYTPTSAFPNRAVCHLTVTYPQTPAGKGWAGTGSLIGSKHVLTAGHVLYKAEEGGWAKTIVVAPGRDGSSPPPFGSEMLTWPNFKQRSVAGWSEDQDIDYDYGLITLNKGFAVGSFGLMYLSDDDLDKTTAYLIGYPGELGSPIGLQQFGVPSGGSLTDYDSTLVYYSMDTSKGQSGAGLYRFWNGERAIFGVHGGGYDTNENRAARITKARYDQIRAWQHEDV